ncbi:MAG TPA: hypothetical protein VMZ91_12325 [Candidatus Paceibacterota bacterium]|nr:hypothetical protein [Candidatus Paceibacterota bacterium]
MNKSIKESQKIVDQLIKKSFPELRGKKIHIKLKKLKKGSMWANKVLYFYFLIKIDPRKYKGATNNEISGALAHELVHFVEFEEMGFFRYIVRYPFYYLSKKFAQKWELNTDRRTIKRGYARDLFANRKFRLKRLGKIDKKIIRNYMTPEEIKSYAKRIGKW